MSELDRITAVDEVLARLVDALSVRPGLTGVNVFSGEMPPDDAGLESIQLVSTTSSQEWGALGAKRREETFTIAGGVRVIVKDAGEGAIRASRGRLVAILTELAGCLWADVSIGGTCRSSSFRLSTVDNFVHPDGRAAICAFEIEVKASLTRSA